MTFDHDLKFERALSHVNDLDAKVRSWLSGDRYTIRYEFDPHARLDLTAVDQSSRISMLGGTVVVPGQVAPASADFSQVEFGEGLGIAFATAEQPPRDPISVLIGEILHNLRSGLDNLAYALASAYTDPLPPDVTEKSEFPIFGDETKAGTPGKGPDLFRDNGRPYIRGWHPDAQTAVERLQPYKRGNDFRSDPLWILHALDNANKHRLLHATVASLDATEWNLALFQNVLAIGPGLIEFPIHPVTTDTPISRFYGLHPADPNADVHMEIRPVLGIAFSDEAPAARSNPVVPTLANIHAHIREEVLPQLVRYL